MAMFSLSIFSSCDKAKAQSDKSFVTDSVGYQSITKAVECSVVADYPTSSDALARAVREYINESLGGTYAGDLAQGDSLVAYYGSSQKDSLLKDAGWIGQSAAQLFYMASIKKIYETATLVTYKTTVSIYQGGAHPSTYVSGATFRKSDGRKFGYDMFRNNFTVPGDISSDVESGLMKYFEVSSAEALRPNLMLGDNVYAIPMPQNVPFITEQGVVLLYGQYEIAPYAAGMPEVVIPIAKAKASYFTSTVKALF